jgi:ATP-dependent RNA helicase DeaD
MSFPPSHPALDRALTARGYAEPTPVQSAVLEADHDNVDMLVSAQTGSGKTVAFGLALASTLLKGAERFERADKPLALIIAPTRELAMQISREFDWLYADTGASIVVCVGGMSVRHEQQQLSRGAHIVIGTPGRLCDHLARGYLDLSQLAVAVLDEADEMLDLGFREELEQLLDATPTERRTLLFSATIARGIAMLAKNYQRDAVRIDTVNRSEPHSDIDYRAMRISPGDTERAVVNVLRYYESGAALVFCATREAVRHLHASLRERGFHAVGLSGEMGQRERNDALQSLRDGHARVCVATDVAARGLDLPDLGLVIHADLPSNKATLLHRSGRTGRAGKKGTSVLLVTHTKRRRTEQVLQSANIIATWSGPPTAAEIRSQDRQRLLEHPALSATVADEDLALAKQLAETLPAEQLASALIGLLRADLPEPEDVSDDARMRDASAPMPMRDRERERMPRAPRPERGPGRGYVESAGDGEWFRLNLGRRRNADPKWLVPLICRLGHITKAEIGPIRVFEDETKFEIVGHAAGAFAVAVQSTLEDNIQITPSSAPQRHDAPRDFAGDNTRPPREARPYRDPRPPREEHARDERAPDARPPREARADADARGDADARRRAVRDEARKQKSEQRAVIDSDPVMAALTTPERETPERVTHVPTAVQNGEPVLNRKQRRDAARAAGELRAAPAAAPAKAWTPDDAPPAASVEPRADRPHADNRFADRRDRPRPPKPGFAKPAHGKAAAFKPRGPRPAEAGADGARPHGKPFKSRGPKPFGGKPSGDRPTGGKPYRGKSTGKPAGKPAAGKRDWRS